MAPGRGFIWSSTGGDRIIPDGMKLDSLGNLYVTANHALGVFVYAPDATLLGHARHDRDVHAAELARAFLDEDLDESADLGGTLPG